MKDADIEKFDMAAKKRSADNLSFRVYALRKEGMSFGKIAKKLGFASASGAQYYLNRYFKTIVEQKNENELRTTGQTNRIDNAVPND